MKLKVTDGASMIEVFFSEDADRKDCERIRHSKMPVSKAFELAKKRLGVVSGIHPVGLEGI